MEDAEKVSTATVLDREIYTFGSLDPVSLEDIGGVVVDTITVAKIYSTEGEPDFTIFVTEGLTGPEAIGYLSWAKDLLQDALNRAARRG